MKTIFKLILFLVIIPSWAQGGSISVGIRGVEDGATSFIVDYFVDIPDVPDKQGSAFFNGFILEFDIDPITGAEVVGSGEQIAFFAEGFGDADGGPFFIEITYSLDEGRSFKKDKLYKVELDRFETELFDFDTNESLGTVFTDVNNPNGEITVGQGLDASSVAFLDFIEQPRAVVKETPVTISFDIKRKPRVTRALYHEFRFEIHVVNKADVKKIQDVEGQELVSESSVGSYTIATGVDSVPGTLSFNAPAIASVDLPEGKAYRVRIRNSNNFSFFNDPPIDASILSPFPYELMVFENEETLSTTDFEFSKSISFYPNPVDGIITLTGEVSNKPYKIFTILGKLVKEVSASKTIEVNELPEGIYFLITDSGTAKFVKK